MILVKNSYIFSGRKLLTLFVMWSLTRRAFFVGRWDFVDFALICKDVWIDNWKSAYVTDSKKYFHLLIFWNICVDIVWLLYSVLNSFFREFWIVVLWTNHNEFVIVRSVIFFLHLMFVTIYPGIHFKYARYAKYTSLIKHSVIRK